MQIKTNNYKSFILGLLLLAVGACADRLEREDVTDISPGDAIGSAASGEYELELYTRECQGACPAIQAGIFTITLCDVGDLERETVEVTQTDGRLVLAAEGLVVDRLMGGIDSDGTFEVGGWGTQYSGSVEVIVRSTGSFTGDSFSGAAESRGHGSVEGTRVDCTAVYEVTGTRIGE